MPFDSCQRTGRIRAIEKREKERERQREKERERGKKREGGRE